MSNEIASCLAIQTIILFFCLHQHFSPSKTIINVFKSVFLKEDASIGLLWKRNNITKSKFQKTWMVISAISYFNRFIFWANKEIWWTKSKWITIHKIIFYTDIALTSRSQLSELWLSELWLSKLWLSELWLSELCT
jgi:hypothetical protein